jgi:hypothetical protein
MPFSCMARSPPCLVKAMHAQGDRRPPVAHVPSLPTAAAREDRGFLPPQIKAAATVNEGVNRCKFLGWCRRHSSLFIRTTHISGETMLG